ncbi:MAG: methyltransferase domain-containing protein [Gammaproteobacteria bacterium]|nr:methyltransferase domain-containing protein [Gammaproteobacteria bacterium]
MEKYDHKAAELLERSYQTPEIVQQRLRTLTALALVDGESVLDVGCGTGLLLEQEARMVGASGRAEGLDASEDMLVHARRRCERLPQVSLQQGSATRLPFDDAGFDALSCTQVLLYVDDLQAALDEFFRVLRPGGRIAIIETDWDGAIIHSNNRDLTRRVLGAWGLAVNNPHLPGRLRPLLEATGFANRRIEAIPLLNAGHSEHSFSVNMLENMARTARRQQTVSREESETWLADLEALRQSDAYFFCVNRFLVSAVKPH